MTTLPAPPVLVPMSTLRIEGPELSGTVVEGGIDWQTLRSDGVLEISAHYVVRTIDGALIEVTSQGLRHASDEVMAQLARGEDVPSERYFFRTLVRFQAGASSWLHLNRVMALAVGERAADAVRLEVYRIT